MKFSMVTDYEFQSMATSSLHPPSDDPAKSAKIRHNDFTFEYDGLPITVDGVVDDFENAGHTDESQRQKDRISTS